MWINKISKNGNAQTVSLPTAVLKILGWERGDYLALQVGEQQSLVITKVAPTAIPDEVLSALKPIKIIHA